MKMSKETPEAKAKAHKERCKAWRADNPARVKAYNQGRGGKWYAANKAEYNAKRRRNTFLNAYYDGLFENENEGK